MREAPAYSRQGEIRYRRVGTFATIHRIDDYLPMDEPGDEHYLLGLIAGVGAVEPRDEVALEALVYLLEQQQEVVGQAARGSAVNPCGRIWGWCRP